MTPSAEAVTSLTTALGVFSRLDGFQVIGVATVSYLAEMIDPHPIWDGTNQLLPDHAMHSIRATFSTSESDGPVASRGFRSCV